MGDLTRHFSVAEFERSETASARGIDNSVREPEVRDALFHLCARVLQPLRDAVRHPLHVNSGYRCPELNAAVGGVKTSQHTRGEAADIAHYDLQDPLELARIARTLGLPYDQIIIYPTFTHISHRLHGTQRGRILYNKSYNGITL